MLFPRLIRRLPLYLSLLVLTQCSKCKQDDPAPRDPASQLPPATQTGANTFGCLLNGQPWIPSGTLNVPNFFVLYDPTYQNGNLDVRTYRVFGSANNNQYLSFGGDGVNKTGKYTVTASVYPPVPGSYTVFFSDNSKTGSCNFYNLLPSTTSVTGYFILTRLDKQQGIVSGTFEFTLAQLGCETIKITDGRFDYKF